MPFVRAIAQSDLRALQRVRWRNRARTMTVVFGIGLCMVIVYPGWELFLAVVCAGLSLAYDLRRLRQYA